MSTANKPNTGITCSKSGNDSLEAADKVEEELLLLHGIQEDELQINTIQSTTADFVVETNGLKAKIKKVQPPMFKCDICGKSVARKQSLKHHRNLHTGEKPYVCDEKDCGEAFSSPALKYAHKKTHRKKKKTNSKSKSPSLDKQLDSMANQVANMLSCIGQQLQRNEIVAETRLEVDDHTVGAMETDSSHDVPTQKNPNDHDPNDNLNDTASANQTEDDPALILEKSPEIPEVPIIYIADDNDEVEASLTKNSNALKLPNLDDSFYDSDEESKAPTPKYVIEIDDTLFNTDSEPDEQSVFGQMRKREQEWEKDDHVSQVAKVENPQIWESPESPESPQSPPPILAQADFSQIDVKQLAESISKVIQQSSTPRGSEVSEDFPEIPDLSSQPPISTFPKTGTYDFVTYYNENNWMFTNNSMELKFYSKVVYSMNPPNPGYYTFNTSTPKKKLPQVVASQLTPVIQKVPEAPAKRCSDERHICRHYAAGRYARLLNKISAIYRKR